ncbi:hypothetical protein C2845_PM02G15810 [Panicum miliaceum]|uniref:CCHC-type domain-containing protein n=1 Tax=Panicum miliaceum TaxID=4540 RepID=A0A3L6SAE9_PANMI|nr:hypothetical protein C2845_PM02G15810 [Panicum miliaceum]
MARHPPPPPPTRPSKRRVERDDWMDKDVLLEPERNTERDLRFKLQRGTGNRSGEDRFASRDHQRNGDQFQGGFERRERSREDGGRGAYHLRAHEESRAAAPQKKFGVGDDSRSRDLRKDLGRGKGDNPNPSQGAHKFDETSKCFRCTEVGHHQLDCTNDPICYKCKQVGHMAAECANIHKRKLMMFGFGIPGQGFYSMEISDKGGAAKFSGLIVVQEGETTEEKLEEEHKNLVKADWDFQVMQVTRDEFRVVFPNQGSLETFSKLSGVVLALYGLRVKISKFDIDPAASSVLQSIWIRITGVPSFAREVEIIKEIASLVAERIKVDEFSMLRDELVRVRVNCSDPTKLRGFVEFFFNGIGYEIKF